MSDVRSLLASGRSALEDHPALATVPFVTALLAVGNIERVAAFRGGHVGLKFPTPAPILDVWSLVSLPGTGASGPSAGPLWLLPGLVILQGVLAAGYLGAIHDALAGRPLAVADRVREHTLPLVGFQLLQFTVALVVVPLAAISPILLVPATLAVIAFSYLFYGTPFLVVTDDDGLVAALERSARLATRNRRYARFFIAVLVGGTVLSVPATAVVVNAGLVGVLVGDLLVAPLAVVVNAAVVALFDDLRPAATATADRPPEPPAGAR